MRGRKVRDCNSWKSLCTCYQWQARVSSVFEIVKVGFLRHHVLEGFHYLEYDTLKNEHYTYGRP
jgi:hypothetical protein